MKKWDKIMFKDCGKCIAMKQSGYIIIWKYKKLLITTIKMKFVVTVQKAMVEAYYPLKDKSTWDI